MSFISIVRKLEEVRASFGWKEEERRWADLPPELLIDIIRRVEASELAWPARQQAAAYAAVCHSWRETTKVVLSGRITFPKFLKQPGPRDSPIHCFVKRDPATRTYCLYLGLFSDLSEKNNKPLLVAHQVKHPNRLEYLITMFSDDSSRTSSAYIGKLRSNILRTKFTVYEGSRPPCNVTAGCFPNRRFCSKQVSPRVPAGNCNVATISYDLTYATPRRMQCIMHSVPVLSTEEGGIVPDSVQTIGEPLILKNKAPWWSERQKCWCLHFRGRVSVPSAKNFQLLAAADSSHQGPVTEKDKVILQFWKIGKDIFTLDYRYPLSAFQSFAICLTSFSPYSHHWTENQL